MNIKLTDKHDSSTLTEDKKDMYAKITTSMREFLEKHPYVVGISAESMIGTQFNNNDTYDKWLSGIDLKITI
jgi:hypothetical protein